jgi:uncharacterized protein (DUF1330 family)
MATQPRPDQIQEFAKKAPKGPLYMLNLLKFKPRAEYADGRQTDLTGAQAYGLYGEGVGKLIAELGGRFVFGGACNVLVVGDGELEWDSVAIVEYPSLEAFQKMTSSEAYQQVHVHREAGLAHQLLIHCLSFEQALQAAGAAQSGS